MPKKKHASKKAARKRAKKQALSNRLDKMAENKPQMKLPKFVEKVNAMSDRFGPRPDRCDGRVTDEFTERTVRHYQSKGIIDAPSKKGKEAIYEYRHVLQALLIRRMLRRQIPAAKIADLLEGKDNKVYRELLSKGIRMSAGPGAAANLEDNQHPAITRGPWIRLAIMPGLEIHVARGFTPPEGPEQFREMMEKIDQVIRRVVDRRRRRH